MVNDIRLRRLTEVVKQRASQVILMELKDPRLGFLTVTRVKLAKDLTMATIFWSIIGSKGDRSKTAHALEDARGYIQSAVAKVMGTRVTPRITLKYDPSMERAQKVHETLAALRRERAERGEPEPPPAPFPEDGDGDGGYDFFDDEGE